MTTPNQIHIKLLTDISDDMDTDSDEYKNFIEHMKAYVPRGVLARKGKLLDKLDAMATREYLGVGQYYHLKKVAELSGNNSVKVMIEKTERKLQTLGQGAPPKIATSVQETVSEQPMPSTSQPCTSPAVPNNKRSRIDEDDPLYSSDSTGRGYYDTRRKKGYLLILNSRENRTGTQADVDNLKNFFEVKLKFDTNDPREHMEEDLSSEELNSCLEGVRTNLNGPLGKQFYCFICVILSHGNEDGIKTRDGKISTEDIRKGFNNKNMPGFAGRPKLFFIQACMGLDTQDSTPVDEADDTVSNQRQAQVNLDEDDVIVHIPNDADTLMAFATTPGYRSYRRTSGDKIGSWFLVEMMEVFERYWTEWHVEEMLITVRENVAFNWVKADGTKQMPSVWSTLTKRLKFQRYDP